MTVIVPIIIDVDGAHIRLLLLTFFYRYQRDLIARGYVYVACPPLYKVTVKASKSSGVSHLSGEHYLYDQTAFDEFMKSLNQPLTTASGNSNGSESNIAGGSAGVTTQIQRFKGLG